MTLYLIGIVAAYAASGVLDPFRCPRTRFWLTLHKEIGIAHQLMESGRNGEARYILVHTASSVFDDLELAFQCSIGISSLHRALALSFVTDGSLHALRSVGPIRVYKVALRFIHVAMNWLTHAFVVEGSNSAQWVDASSWQITLQEINQEETFIQKFLDNNGGRAHPTRWEEIPVHYRDPKLRIAIVSVCDYPPDNPLPTLSQSNREMYAKRHGYEIINSTKRFDSRRPHAWAKITLLRNHILSAEYDWLFWFDCDTYFMNFNVTLDHLLYKYGSEVDMKGDHVLRKDFKMLIQEDHAMINTGVFFLRTGDWSDGLLQLVYSTPAWGLPGHNLFDPNRKSETVEGTGEHTGYNLFTMHPWWENAAFSHVFLGALSSRMIDLESHRGHPEDDMVGIYPVGVVVAPQYEFNSYHPITSRVSMHDNWEPGKFVLAFSGCKSGSSPQVVKALYESYYFHMCKLNNLVGECIPESQYIN